MNRKSKHEVISTHRIKKRVTIKISGKLHRKLVLFRKKTGIPISRILLEAVSWITRGRRGGIIRRRGTMRGSR